MNKIYKLFLVQFFILLPWWRQKPTSFYAMNSHKNPKVQNQIAIKFTTVLVFLLLGIILNIFSQIPFIFYDSVPITQENDTLQNAWAGGLNCPQFSEIDLNGDGQKDLVAFERNFYGSIKTFINEGSEGEVIYKYAPEYQSRFPQMRNWMLLRDYNCDGKEDIFTSVPAGVAVYKNITEPGQKLQFTKITSLLQTIGLDGQTPLYVSPPDIPAIADIDNDGDLDILSFNILGSTVEYHKNLSIENYGNCDQLEYELKNACWGYFSEDGNNNTVTLYDTCEMNVIDPEKSEKHAGSTILAIDLTGNGIKDLVLGDLTYTNMVQITNGGTTSSAGMVSFDTTFPSNSIPIDLTVFPAAYNIDVDNDGKKDLIIAPNNPNTSENINNTWYYKNEGTSTTPQFNFQQNDFLYESLVDVGESSFPVFFDENADGLQDIIVGHFGYFIESGNYLSQLMLLRNTGTIILPSFEVITSDYANLSIYNFDGIYPAFGDLDNDGDKDLLTGDEEGMLHYFRNDAESGGPANFVLSQPNFKGIDVGQSAKPQIIDVNRDGLNDLLVGERSGTINYFENIGTPENAEFSSEPNNDLFGGIDVMPECCTGYSAPFMAEDSTGNYMLYVGSEQGKLYLFNNIETNLNGDFNLVDSLYLSGVNVNVSGVDINDDNKTELVFGELAGGIGLLKSGVPGDLGIFNLKANNVSISVYPNPAQDFIFFQVDKDDEMKNIQLQIINMMGEVVKQVTLPNVTESNYINIDKLTTGLYFLTIRYGNQIGSKKFLKQ